MRPCWGRAALFDSTDPGDHTEAKAICATCPFIDDCATELANAQRDHPGGPVGTWAGQLLIAGTVTPSRTPRCKNGHELVGDNARIKFNPDGTRASVVCRACERAKHQRKRRRACKHCATPIAAEVRIDIRYCSDECRANERRTQWRKHKKDSRDAA